jgi:hypothetical protein
LRVNDIIVIPCPEDLDPRYIGLAGGQTHPLRNRGQRKPTELVGMSEPRRSGPGGSTESAVDALPSSMGEPPTGKHKGEATGIERPPAIGEGTATRHSSRSNSELNLPAANRDLILSHGRRSIVHHSAVHRDYDDDNELGMRTTARPRPANSHQIPTPATRPVYKVGPSDTLRSIAHHTLGNARRSNEILDLNRDIIDDPDNLIVGQILLLPDDAQVSIHRTTSR